MPFKGVCAMDERVRFCVLFDAGETTMSELCRQFGISRKSGYEVLERWRSGGASALAERSHAPHCCPHAIDGVRGEALLAARRRHPTWGPRKIKRYLEVNAASTDWPAASSIGELYAREGLSVPRRRRRRVCPRTEPFADCTSPNDTWSIDFKGYFLTGEGVRCDPLTLQDQCSRFLLRLVAMDRLDWEHVWAVLEAAFREFGLPARMRSDNGSPFASTGAGGLSTLSVKLVKAGITLERIDPGAPQQNGRLERLHLTLEQDTASPPAASLRAQKDRFRSFRRTYNEERPHEALAMATPASVYTASPRPWSGRLASPEYGQGVAVRRVRHNGEIKWHGETVYVSCALVGEPVSIEEGEDGLWRVNFGPVHLGTISDGRLQAPRAVRAPGRRSRAALRPNSDHDTNSQSVTHHAG